jgi:hypothetical protein
VRASCLYKRAYTEPEARRHLAEALRERILGNAHRREQTAYECAECGSWHLSASERHDGRFIAARPKEELA